MEIKFLLNYFLNAPFSDYIFYFAMVIVVILSKINLKRREMLVNSIASIGMIGTFFGICKGLQNFDSNNIAESVPILLLGMKTAFYTSLIGTLGTIILKVIYGICSKKSDPIEDEFFENNRKQRKENEKIIELLNNQLKSQQNLYSKLLEKEVKNNMLLTTLIESFKNFQTSMAQENNKAFVEAINSCIKNLNKEMMEQLGENFNKFNEGMMRLVTWQEKYVDIIKATEHSQEKLVNSFEIIEAKLNHITNSISEFTNKANEIIQITSSLSIIINEENKSINNLNMQEERLNANLSEIADLNRDLFEFKETLGRIVNYTAENTKNTNENIVLINQHTENLLNSFEMTTNKLREFTSTVQVECEKMAENTAVGMELTNKKVGELLEKHVNNIESELANSLKISLESLGEELAILSEKFVEDYTPLTEKLQKIIKIAEKVK